eukprot:FR738435.1.p1 GENE.FR738435.1~~FR738435.1.p1  ORF type:complete len:100 (-),score=5.11 FR738435.1:116-415(-)
MVLPAVFVFGLRHRFWLFCRLSGRCCDWCRALCASSSFLVNLLQQKPSTSIEFLFIWIQWMDVRFFRKSKPAKRLTSGLIFADERTVQMGVEICEAFDR